MSGICGYWSEAGGVEPAVLEAMLRVLVRHPAEQVATLEGERLALASARHGGPLAGEAGGVRCVLAGNPRLGAAPAGDVARAFAQRYRDEGAGALRALRGHFALALVDDARREVLLAVDRMGTQSLSWAASGDSLVFGSDGLVLGQHPALGREIDHQSVFNYLYFHAVPGTKTVTRGIERLAPGHYLRLADGRVSLAAYWAVSFDDSPPADYPALRDEFHALLDAGVREAREGMRSGTFLSGGTDSSTVTGFARRQAEAPVPSFSIGFAAPGYDEMEFAREAARHFGVEHHEYYLTPADIVAAIPLIAQSYEQPYGNSSAVPTLYCARLAREHDVECLLAGDGGDELFGGNERYAKQHVFSYYDRLPQALRRAALEPLAAAIPAATALTPLRKLRRYVEQASTPMPIRMESYNVLSHLGLRRVLSEDFLGSIDPDEPHRLLRECYARTHSAHLVNRMLALDFQFTLADNDLPKVTRMCDAAGVDVRFPLLSDALVEFSTRLPHRYKLAGTRLRPFFKRALTDFLPRKVITKSKHGFGLPFGPWFREHPDLREIITDSLRGLESRGIVRAGFADELTRDFVTRHAAYYGTMVWVLAMLEQWFRHHVDAAAGPARSLSRVAGSRSGA